MSSRTSVRTVNIKIKDEFTPYLMAISREMRSTSREIHFLEMAFYALEEAEAAAEAEELGLIEIAQLAIPVIGVFAAGVSMMAGAALISHRGAGIIPVGQTRVGEARKLMSSGPVWGHAGESLGRLGPPESMGAGEGAGFYVNIEDLQMQPDGETPQAIGSMFRQVRNSYSTDIPST